MNQDKSIIGMEVCSNSNLFEPFECIMPYPCGSNYDEYMKYLSKTSTHCDEISSPNVYTDGDFKACPKTILTVCFPRSV